MSTETVIPPSNTSTTVVTPPPPPAQKTIADYIHMAATYIILAISAAVGYGWINSDTAGKIKSIIQKVDDNRQAISDDIKAVHDKIPSPTTIVVTDPTKIPIVSPAISPELAALIAELKALIEAANKPKPVIDPPKPVVIPPKPSPSPTQTQIAITATVAGKTITTIDAGRQFTVMSTGSEKVQSWDVELITVDSTGAIKSQPWDGSIIYDSADVAPFPDGGGFAITLRSGSVGIVGSGTDSGTVRQSRIRIVCNQAPQPPPVVDVPPFVTPPIPTPNVVPGSKRFTLYVVEDPTVKRSITTASILNNLAIRKTLSDRGHTVVPTVSTATDPGATYVKSHQETMPALLVFDNNQFVKSVPLPTDLGLSVISGIGG